MDFPVIDGKYIKLEFRKEFKNLFLNLYEFFFEIKKIRKFIFFLKLGRILKKNLERIFEII